MGSDSLCAIIGDDTTHSSAPSTGTVNDAAFADHDTVATTATNDHDNETEDTEDDEQTVECDRCLAQVHEDATRVLHDDTIWCGTCFDLHGSTCRRCDESFSENDIDLDRFDEPYCWGCQDNGYGAFSRDDDDDDGDYDDDGGNDIIASYDSTVFEVLAIAAPADTSLYYGFEIELNTRDGSRYEAAQAFIERANGHGIVKHDGSIGYGRSGIELVSVPLTLDAIRLFLGQVFVSDSLHGSAFADESCGMHVHLSRVALTTPQIAKLVRFIHTPTNQTFMEQLAGRTLVDSRWASIDHRTGSWKAVFHPTVSGNMRIWDAYRYSALNLTNSDTIEFRIFASTTSVARARANIEACAALTSFCADATHSLSETVCHRAFCGFIDRRRREYPHLATRLAELASATTFGFRSPVAA